MSGFKLTYSTMFSPPRELHDRFASAADTLAQGFGKHHSLFIDGTDVYKEETTTKLDPADQNRVIGRFSLADEADADTAVAAARQAYPAWRRLPWQQRVSLMRNVARLVEERLYDIAAAVSFEVGKNRMEALGEVAEVVEFFELYARQMEDNNGYDHALPDDPLPGVKSRNRSILRPYGVWIVVAPFNFPFALAGGPTAAALVAGNTVVLKGAVETPWSGALLAQCIHDAGVPRGVFNYLVGDGATVGDALVKHEGIGGITFTGSYDVGMHILRTQLARPFPRPCIAEMGGKNAVIVTAKADLEVATQGIIRSAYGMSGQKCSALSRIYVDKRVADDLIGHLQYAIRAIRLGDPRQEQTWMGPVTTRKAYENFKKYCAALETQGASILAGGRTSLHAGMENGLFCEPTLAEAPLPHPLWDEEMFAPISMLGRVEGAAHAMELANASKFGLTAGFYGSDEEVEWFFANIEAGVTYANRPQGATTGAWPGYQPFGGWKGSGSTGKALASFYYLPQYMREQSQTHIEY